MKNTLNKILLYFNAANNGLFMFFAGEKPIDIKLHSFVVIGNYYNNNLNDIDTAKEYYTKALNLKQDYFYALIGIGSAYGKSKNYDKAYDYFSTALALKPKDEFTTLWLVILHEQLQHDEQYQETLHKAIKLVDSKLTVYDWLAEMYYKLEMYTEAEVYCNKALDENPTAVSFFYNSVLIHAAQQNFSLALEASYKALQYAKEKKWKKKINKNIKYFKEVAVTSN